MKKFQLLLVALALVSFTAFYSCGNSKEKAAEAVEEVVVEEAVVEEAEVTEEVVAEEAEVEATEEASAE